MLVRYIELCGGSGQGTQKDLAHKSAWPSETYLIRTADFLVLDECTFKFQGE
jgi:hypothetical protein